MDRQAVIDVLVSSQSGENELRANAEVEINAMIAADMSGFLNLLLDLSIQAVEPKVCSICATYVYMLSCHNPNFRTIGVQNSFWPHFSAAIPSILTSQCLDKTQKLLMSNVISNICTFFASIGDIETVQSYIMLLPSKIQDPFDFISHAITETLVTCNDFCGFSEDFLVQMLSYQYDPTQKLCLLFAIASKDHDIQALHQIFGSIIQEPALPSTLCHLIDFVETTPSFLAPHIDTFTEYICKASLSTDPRCRQPAIMLLRTVAESDPEMCRASPQFYQPTIRTLIQIMTEICDNSAWEFDANDNEPCTEAKESFKAVINCSNCTEAIAYFFELKDSVFSQEGASWQSIYAVLAAISCMKSQALSTILPDDRNIFNKNDLTPIRDFVLPLISALEDPDAHPRIRCAIYDVIITFSKELRPIFQKAVMDSIFPLLRQLVNAEQHENVKRRAAKALLNFVKNVKLSVNQEQYSQLFDELIEDITRAPVYTMPIMVKCLAHVVIMAPHQVVPDFNLLSEVFYRLLDASQDAAMKSVIIHAFSISCGERNLSTEHVKICTRFLEEAISLGQEPQALDDKQADTCEKSIRKLIKLVGKFSDLTSLLLPSFQSASVRIEPAFVDLYEPFNEAIFCIRIPSRIPGSKCFVKKSEIYPIKSALKRILACLSTIDMVSYIPQAVEVCRLWIANPDSIEPIKRPAWKLLFACFTEQKDLLPLIIDLYLHEASIDSSAVYTGFVVSTIDECLKLSQAIDKEKFEQILRTISQLIDKFAGIKLDKVTAQQQWRVVDMSDPSIASQDEAMLTVASLFSRCLSINAALTTAYYFQYLDEKLNAFLQMEELRQFAVVMEFEYLTATGDFQKLSQLSDTFANFAMMNVSDLREVLFDGYGRFFEAYKLDESTANYYYSMFSQVLSDDNIINETNCLVEDHVVIAFTSLIKNSLIANEEGLQMWLDNLNIHDDHQGNEMVFNFFLDLLLSRNPVIVTEDNFFKIVEHTIISQMRLSIGSEVRKRFDQFYQMCMQDSALAGWLNEAILELREQSDFVAAQFCKYLHSVKEAILRQRREEEETLQ